MTKDKQKDLAVLAAGDLFWYCCDMAFVYIVMVYSWGLQMQNVTVFIVVGIFGRWLYSLISRVREFDRAQRAARDEGHFGGCVQRHGPIVDVSGNSSNIPPVPPRKRDNNMDLSGMGRPGVHRGDDK